jgi:hypothetical protein
MTLLSATGEPQYRVLIAVPCGDMVHSLFAYDLAMLVGYTQMVRPEMPVHLSVLRGIYLPRARATLVAHAESVQATHILWLDADMRFPKDALIRLLLHDQPIVGCNYPTRVPPILPTALAPDGAPLFHAEGLADVSLMGMGCLLTATEVFGKIGKPYFALGYAPSTDDYSGEDDFFFNKARKAGYAVTVDGGLSEEVLHLGQFPYGMAHARMTQSAASKES